ncbi:putative iron(III) dicitrate transport ATP-binding protein FecE [delta proteobacterium NaphS2]|nr:putative iron(III) dicitrate transport ATP-binding protein FecE [delta proteobacterium NaphS2]
MIRVEALCCGYDKKDVLKNLSFHLKRGEFAGVLGPNGSGKSTLLFALSGVLPIRSGSVRINGKEISRISMRARARQMASVPQKPEISFSFKCLSIVLMGRYPFLSGWGGYSALDVEKALEAMARTETLHLAQRMITDVSGGEAQGVLIAKALAQETDILLLDEPTSSLDVARKIQVFDLLKQKNSENTTILCALHDLNLAALYCDRLIFVKHGKIVLDGSTEETFNDENLSEIYETDVRVSRHPVTGSPQAHFVPGFKAASSVHGHVLGRREPVSGGNSSDYG